MPSAAEFVAAREEALGRPLRFDEYLDEALYGAAGFYQSGGRAGRRGDFLTSAEVGPLFGAVVGRWISAEFDRLGRPDDFRIVEAGAGSGALARAVLTEWPEWGERYVTVEVSEAQRAMHPSGIRVEASMPDDVRTGVVIANELLDNLPFRLAVFDHGWREALVHVERDGRLVEVLTTAPDEWHSLLPAAAPLGARAPIQERASSWVRHAQSSVERGRVLVFDYCTPLTASLALTPWREWLRTYRGHERAGHYLRDVGLCNVTVQVCLDQLPEPAAVRSQAQFLQRWGIDELVDEGRRVWEERAARPDLLAMRMRSRVRESEALLDTAGLGAFHALEWRAGDE